MKERRAAAAVFFGNFDPHHAEIEQLVDQRARDLRVLVHLADERTDLAVRKLVHTVSKQSFVVTQRRQRLHDRMVSFRMTADMAPAAPKRSARRRVGFASAVLFASVLRLQSQST